MDAKTFTELVDRRASMLPPEPEKVVFIGVSLLGRIAVVACKDESSEHTTMQITSADHDPNSQEYQATTLQLNGLDDAMQYPHGSMHVTLKIERDENGKKTVIGCRWGSREYREYIEEISKQELALVGQ